MTETDSHGTDIPDWANEQHISLGGEHHCSDCFNLETASELQTTDSYRTPGWRGVNWSDGYCEKVECPSCQRSGSLTTKKLSTFGGPNTQFERDGVAANPVEYLEAEMDSETLMP